VMPFRVVRDGSGEAGEKAPEREGRVTRDEASLAFR